MFTSAHRADRVVDSNDVLDFDSLADTFEVLAIEGEELFYRGEIARELTRMCDVGGHLTADDLRAYETH